MHEKWMVVLVENINIVQKKMDDIQWHSFYGLNKYLWNSSTTDIIGKEVGNN
jgi:hypothetical protein